MNGETFKAYVEQFLAPTLKRGDIVFMDNASVHMVDGVEEVIEARGNSVLPSGIQPEPESDRATVCQAQVHASQDCRIFSQASSVHRR
jgi:transposase